MDIDELSYDAQSFDLSIGQWKEFCRKVLVPMAEGNARSMNKALDNLVRGNLDGYALWLQRKQMQRTAKILTDHMVAYFDLCPKWTEHYVDRLGQCYYELMISMLDKHAIVEWHAQPRRGELDLFTYHPVQQIATPE